ncbi:hypothetical protein M3936_11885 [Sutcliffiella horikoshii]|uniref:hypothetical protein n=1 Tax=Sutcliffiella horikoshii TaxID=79883 RepID=UPI00203C8868|nr:hypothetical protein [Sutcliffiella horikoshii]MCM3618279.1 hypothetical protein [Sutcliffiella horikoshii]
MFTYSSFEIAGAFALLRPILYTLLVANVLLFILNIVPRLKAKYLNSFIVLGASFLKVVIALQVVFFGAVVADELNLAGDTVGMILLMLIVGISALNILIYLISSKDT